MLTFCRLLELPQPPHPSAPTHTVIFLMNKSRSYVSCSFVFSDVLSILRFSMISCPLMSELVSSTGFECTWKHTEAHGSPCARHQLTQGKLPWLHNKISHYLKYTHILLLTHRVCLFPSVTVMCVCTCMDNWPHMYVKCLFAC